MVIYNSYFANNSNTQGNGGVIVVNAWNIDNKIVIIYNCTFINNSASGKGGVINAKNPFKSINNYYEGNTAYESGVVARNIDGDYYFENDTFVNNRATTKSGVCSSDSYGRGNNIFC